jgi:hypothetical protein
MMVNQAVKLMLDDFLEFLRHLVNFIFITVQSFERIQGPFRSGNHLSVDNQLSGLDEAVPLKIIPFFFIHHIKVFQPDNAFAQFFDIRFKQLMLGSMPGADPDPPGNFLCQAGIFIIKFIFIPWRKEPG